MKTTKIAIIATIITIVVILSTAYAMPATAEADRGEFYPKLAVTTGYKQLGDADEWLITCTDRNGHKWSFYGEKKDAHIGIMFNLLMWNIGETEEDDEIIEVYYEDQLTPAEMMKFLP